MKTSYKSFKIARDEHLRPRATEESVRQQLIMYDCELLTLIYTRKYPNYSLTSVTGTVCLLQLQFLILFLSFYSVPYTKSEGDIDPSPMQI